MIDVLILDDVHEFAGKKNSRCIFSHIKPSASSGSFNSNIGSATRPKLQGLEQRYYLALKWGPFR
jgi:chromosomal replication initiator protein